MTTYEDNLLATRFAALAPEPLPGDWDDVLGRAGVARDGRPRLEPSHARDKHRRRRWGLVAVAAVILVGGLLVAPAFGIGSRLLELIWRPPADHDVWAASWSPVGRKIAFQLRQDGYVYVANADGSGLRPLTDRAPSGDFVWSPDGRQIAVDGERSGRPEIQLVNVDGSGSRNLTRDWGVGSLPVWSPSGRKLAFSSDRVGNGEIYVVNADGSGLQRLTRNSRNDRGARWSPDGRRIAFMRDRGTPHFSEDDAPYVMNADGSGQRQLVAFPFWSPDGQRMAFSSVHEGRPEIYVANADGSALRRLTSSKGKDFGPAWSPDGKTIAFVSWRDGSAGVYVMNADGSGQRNLTPAPGNDWLVGWSPDGRKIAFMRGKTETATTTDIYVMNADGSGQRNLTRDAAHEEWPAWSADGQKLGFLSDRSGSYRLYVVNPDGTGLRLVAPRGS